VPQVLVLAFDTQLEPQACRPLVQLKPQLVPSQVAVPLGDVGHAVHELPQVATALSETHCVPHR
jgi:hypothetical protein